MSSALSSAFKILCLGPNPAFQKVVRFESPVQLGSVNRASSVSTYVGGKGQGAALAINRFAPGSASVSHFLGGDTGSYIEASLAAAGIDQVIQKVEAPTRVCTTLTTVGDPSQTELIDPSGAISEEELSGLLAKTTDYLTAGAGVGGIALCGTTPPGTSTLYERVAGRLVDGGDATSSIVLLLDGNKGVEATLASGRVDVLKINLDEAKALTKEATAELAAHALLYKADAPLQSRPASMVALTDGPHAARLFFKAGKAASSFSLKIPEIECVNAIGAGDVCTGVFLAKLVEACGGSGSGSGGSSSAGGGASGTVLDAAAAADAFAWGLAAACARCTHDLPEQSTREEVDAMRSRISIEEVAVVAA